MTPPPDKPRSKEELLAALRDGNHREGVLETTTDTQAEELRQQQDEILSLKDVQAQHILLVEDHEDSAQATADFLRLHGYEVTVAISVQEALDLVEQGDVVISDISLPDGTGHDLMRQILSRHPIRAIALSGYGSAEDIRRSSEAGFARHITKPVDPARLLQALQELAS